MFQFIVSSILLILKLFWAYAKAFLRLFIRPSKVSVAGKIVVVTGSGSGLGREIAVRLAAEGARLALWDISENGNKETAGQIRASIPDAEVHIYTVDVTQKDVVKAMALKVQSELGQVYMLINNAGILVGETLLALKDEDIQRTININLMASFWTLRAFLPPMLESNDGHIVTTCSTGGQTAIHRMTDYCASKFGIVGLDEALELEIRDVYKKDGIRQSLVCPHFLSTGLIHSVEQKVHGMYEAGDAADVIVDEILRQYRYIFFPKTFRFAATLKQLLPHEGRLAMMDFLGIRVSSQNKAGLHED